MTDSKEPPASHLPKELQLLLTTKPCAKWIDVKDNKAIIVVATDSDGSRTVIIATSKKKGADSASFVFESGLMTSYTVFQGGLDFVAGNAGPDKWSKEVQKSATESCTKAIQDEIAGDACLVDIEEFERAVIQSV